MRCISVSALLRLSKQCLHLHVVSAGLQSLLSVQSSYQLSKYSAASLAFTYQPAIGTGMQVKFLSHIAVPVQHNLSNELPIKASVAHTLKKFCHLTSHALM